MNDVEVETVALALLDEDAADEGVTAEQIATRAGISLGDVVFLLRGSKKVYPSTAEGPGPRGVARYRRY